MFRSYQNFLMRKWKIFFDVHSQYISDDTMHIVFYCGFILKFCARFLSQCIALLQMDGNSCSVIEKGQNMMVE
jgi:hypothetical protein